MTRRYCKVALSIVLFASFTQAWEQCNDDFYCPTGNTCCFNKNIKGCISNDMGAYNATCCDSEDDGSNTGCPVGYNCLIEQNHDEIGDQFRNIRTTSIARRARSKEGSSRINPSPSIPSTDFDHYCMATNKTYAPMADEFVKVLPRYHLCHVSPSMTQLHGFEIDGNKLGYYSSHGKIFQNINHDYAMEQKEAFYNTTNEVEMIWIVIHGSGRNADDYFCSALAAVELQNQWKNVWVIVPRFFEESDKPPKDFLYWKSNPDDGDGTWRYGANSLNGGFGTGVSSYTAFDKLIEHEWIQNLPNLKQIVIAGHSSGGQFVHRWSLITQVWKEEYNNKMKSVVANPTWEVPSASILKDCPNYNKWEWGLDDGGALQVPYRDNVFEHKSKADVIDSFRRRRIIYLSGSLDKCPGEKVMECHSHGIETTCMDELQGKNRFDRSLFYAKSLTQPSLNQRGGWKSHERFVVHGVGHDHSLMWTAQAGLDAIFSEVETFV